MKSKFQGSIVYTLLGLTALAMSACSTGAVSNTSTDTVPSPLPPQTEVAAATETPSDVMSGWKEYQNPAAGLSFQYPEDWFGPEVYEVDSDLRIEIGSDVVYPYGTGRELQIYDQTDSYYIVIEYRPNTEGESMDDYEASTWISPVLDIMALSDGMTIETARSLVIRQREVTIGQFKGVEYIATLSDTAQTERTYSRQLFLMDDNLNILMISGIPNNVQVGDPQNWKLDFQRVDESYLDIFYQVLESIVIE